MTRYILVRITEKEGLLTSEFYKSGRNNRRTKNMVFVKVLDFSYKFMSMQSINKVMDTIPLDKSQYVDIVNIEYVNKTISFIDNIPEYINSGNFPLRGNAINEVEAYGGYYRKEIYEPKFIFDIINSNMPHFNKALCDKCNKGYIMPQKTSKFSCDNCGDTVSKVEYKKRIKMSTKVKIGEDVVRISSDRYILFNESAECIRCGVVGAFFAKERHSKKNGYHLNLYGVDEKGNAVIMTKDHTIPSILGGKDSLMNYRTMCTTCNGHKSDREIDGLPPKMFGRLVAGFYNTLQLKFNLLNSGDMTYEGKLIFKEELSYITQDLYETSLLLQILHLNIKTIMAYDLMDNIMIDMVSTEEIRNNAEELVARMSTKSARIDKNSVLKKTKKERSGYKINNIKSIKKFEKRNKINFDMAVLEAFNESIKQEIPYIERIKDVKLASMNKHMRVEVIRYIKHLGYDAVYLSHHGNRGKSDIKSDYSKAHIFIPDFVNKTGPTICPKCKLGYLDKKDETYACRNKSCKKTYNESEYNKIKEDKENLG